MGNPARAEAEVYRRAILAEVPRLLGLMDREPFSPTRGCCDRVYWAWKFTDFPGARFQEALCVLSFLYSTPFEGNDCHASPNVLQWIEAGLRYWSSIQYPDGSFDEAYPYERSLAATAFTAFYVGEALEFLGTALPAATRDLSVDTLRRAGDWLCRNDETHGFLSNHLAAAAAALLHVSRSTGAAQYEARCRYFIGRILSHQSGEGWYDEYGSADPGYQTHGSFYLARIWQLTGDAALLESLDRATQFLARCIHPDGSIGGEYASRNTQTHYPAAFEMLAGASRAAAWIAACMRVHAGSGDAVDLRGVDSYNYFPMLNNTVFAWLACTAGSAATDSAAEPGADETLCWFPQAGIARIRRPRYELWVGTAKGGVIKVFDRASRRLVYSDCGYIGRLANGRVVSSQYLDADRNVSVSAQRIELDGRFFETARPVMKPLRFLAFRGFMLSFGRLPALAQWLKRYLVKVLIYRKHGLAISFRRCIECHDDHVTVRDHIAGADGQRITTLEHRALFTTIHMGSSRYFINNELNVLPPFSNAVLSGAQISAGVELEQAVQFDSTARTAHG